jgi:hypothetical protein
MGKLLANLMGAADGIDAMLEAAQSGRDAP